jgi:hypothetical protein
VRKPAALLAFSTRGTARKLPAKQVGRLRSKLLQGFFSRIMFELNSPSVNALVDADVSAFETTADMPAA